MMALAGVELETLNVFCTCTDVMPAAEVIEPNAIRL